MGPIILVAVLVVVLLAVLVSCFKIVPQAQAYVIERLGAYQGTWSVGFHVKVPFLDKVRFSCQWYWEYRSDTSRFFSKTMTWQDQTF